MLAELDLLLTSVFCTADDLLPKGPENARRSLTDAEVVTLCVAQSIMGVSSDARFTRIARKRLGHLFPALTKRSGFHKRRDRLIERVGCVNPIRAEKDALTSDWWSSRTLVRKPQRPCLPPSLAIRSGGLRSAQAHAWR